MFTVLLSLCCFGQICRSDVVDVSGWKFTFRHREGDSDREPIDVVEDYLDFVPTPEEWKGKLDDILITSANTEDYEFISHMTGCSCEDCRPTTRMRTNITRKKKVVLKTESFYELATKSETFQDRTLLMAELFTKKFAKHIHLKRRAGWGKTVALDMIRKFLELEVDKNGRPLPETSKVNRKIFEGGKVCIDNQTKVLPTLKIGNRDLMVDKFGRFPIMYFSFKNVTGTNFNEIFINLRDELVKLHRQHRYLWPVFKKLRKFKVHEVKSFLKFYKNQTDQINVHDTQTCLLHLVRAMKHFYKKRPMVMFDDYDMPFRSSYEHIFGNEDEVYNVMDLIDGVYWQLMNGTFTDHRKLFTTGVLPVPRFKDRMFHYFEFPLLRYELDLYIGIRDKSTLGYLSREWKTRTTYFWPTEAEGMDL